MSLHLAFDLTLPARTRTGSWVYATELLAQLERRPEYRVSVLNHPKRWPGRRAGERLLNAAELTLWMQTALPWRLSRLRPDLLHAPAFVTPVASPCPIVVNIHDTTYLTLPTDPLWGLYARAFTALAVRRASAILTLSESSKRDIVGHYRVSPDRVVVVPLGVHPRFRPLDKAEARAVVAQKYGLAAPFVLFVSALEERKNVPTLLRAFAQFKRTPAGQAARLALVGKPGGAWPEIQRGVADLGLASEVVCLGHAPTDDLPLFYSAAAVFAFPSLYEGFGIPVAEAMACGTPVITSNVSSLPEVGGDAALYVDPHDVDGLAAALGRVLGDAALRDALSARGLVQAARFTWDEVARQTVAVYHDVLRFGRPQASGRTEPSSF